MGARLFESVALLVLLGCAAILGEVTWTFASGAPTSVDTPAATPAKAGDVGQEPQAGVAPARDLTRHLPMAGMPNAPVDDPDACRRVEGFVVDAVHELRTQGVNPPFAPTLLKTALDAQRCRVDSPEVHEILGHLGRAYAEAGLELVQPMHNAQ